MYSNLSIGDTVKVKVDQEARAWGYDPCPDGTLATIVDFEEIAWGHTNNCNIPPGIYRNFCWPIIKIEGINKAERISFVYVKNVDRSIPCVNKTERVRDLPKLPFYEEDIVRLVGSNNQIGTIDYIDYGNLNCTCSDGSEFPIYNVRIKGQGIKALTSCQIDLFERGYAWKYYHGEPMIFASLEAEVEANQKLGFTEEVMNPNNQSYIWTLPEILAGIKQGIIHGMTYNGGIFGELRSIRFKDEQLGKRVAKTILQEFDK